MSEGIVCPQHINTFKVNTETKAAVDTYMKFASFSDAEGKTEDIMNIQRVFGIEHMNMSLFHATLEMFRSSIENEDVWKGDLSVHSLAELFNLETTYDTIELTFTEFEKKKIKSDLDREEIIVGRMINAYRYLRKLSTHPSKDTDEEYNIEKDIVDYIEYGSDTNETDDEEQYVTDDDEENKDIDYIRSETRELGDEDLLM